MPTITLVALTLITIDIALILDFFTYTASNIKSVTAFYTNWALRL